MDSTDRSDAEHEVKDARHRAARRLECALAFFTGSALALVPLLFEGLLGSDDPVGAIHAVPYAIASASVVALVVALALLALHALESALPGRRGAWVASAALVAATLPLAIPVGAELASGDGISTKLDPRVGAPLAALAIELGLFALYRWHRHVFVRAVARPSPGLATLASGAAGLAVAALAGSALASGLEAYAFLVDLVTIVFVTATGTAFFVPLARSFALRRAVVGGFFAVGALSLARTAESPVAFAEGREVLVPTSQVAARVDRLLWDPPGFGSLRVDAAAVVCDAQPPAAHPEPFPLPEGRPRNVLVVSIDALRSDAVRWERDGRPLMPHLSAFFDRSVLAPAAVSTYPATIFAVGGALTGLTPSRMLFAPAPPRTVLEDLAARADVRSAHLPSVHWFRKAAVGRLLLRGLVARRHRTAASQIRATIDEITRARAAGKSHVTWVHLYEPHGPYERHEGFDFGAGARDRYASELAYVDAELGALFGFLERSGAYEDTLVVLFADHGEALGERGYQGHHVYLDGFMTDVPIAVRAPGVAPRVVDGVVSLTDVAATLAHYAGLPLAPESSGWSLLAGDPPRERAAISEAFPIRGHELFRIADRPVSSLAELDARMERIHEGAQRYSPKAALVTRDFRLIADRRSGIRELYRRGAPSSVQPNVARRRPRELARLTDLLARWHRETGRAIHCAVQDAAAAEVSTPASVTR